jgi:DNA-binding NarL/FixJ family response regulator
VTGLLRQLDFFGEELREIDRQFGAEALARPEVRRLMTIPGVDATVALSIVAAVGDFHRFSSPEKLVAYLGLNPRVRQSGGQPASHGRITKQGRAHARGMLVEAAWVAVKSPGPLRAFFTRIRARRGMQIAVVATARKLAVLCWHLIIKQEDYAFALLSQGAAGVGYLLKERVGDLDELARALREASRGGSVLDSLVVEALLARRGSDAPLLGLTERERAVLHEMATGRNNAAIAKTLFLSDRAVEKHIGSVFQKLGLGDEKEVSRRVMAVLAYLEASGTSR